MNLNAKTSHDDCACFISKIFNEIMNYFEVRHDKFIFPNQRRFIIIYFFDYLFYFDSFLEVSIRNDNFDEFKFMI